MSITDVLSEFGLERLDLTALDTVSTFEVFFVLVLLLVDDGMRS